jgi:DNA-binding Xre family transcriptional regulator
MADTKNETNHWKLCNSSSATTSGPYANAYCKELCGERCVRNQKDFSKLCGLGRSYFGRLERGKRDLTFSSLCQICAGLNCDIATVTEGIFHLIDAPG